MLNLRPWGLVCSSRGRELSWVGPTAFPVLGQFSRSPVGRYRHTINRDLKGTGSLPPALWSSWDARRVLCPLSPSLAGAQLRNICFCIRPPPSRPSHFSLITPMWIPPHTAEVGGKKKAYCLWGFQLRNGLPGPVPHLLEIAKAGGLGPISWRSSLRSSCVDISRVSSSMPVPTCPGSQS